MKPDTVLGVGNCGKESGPNFFRPSHYEPSLLGPRERETKVVGRSECGFSVATLASVVVVPKTCLKVRKMQPRPSLPCHPSSR